MTAPRIWFDVTTSSKWTGAPVGIVRTEVEIAKQLQMLDDARIDFCRYDAPSGCFVEIRAESLRSVLGSGVGKVAEWSPEWNWSRVSRALRRRARRIVPEKPIALSARHPFSPGDIYISTGMDVWDKDLRLLAEIRQAASLRVITTSYDLIPMRFPHLINDHLRTLVPSRTRELLTLSDCVLCISDDTLEDTRAFIAEWEGPRLRFERITLGSNVPTDARTTAGRAVPDSRDPFILFVSSLFRRKNHEVLYRAYRRLLESRPDIVPKMLWVGSPTDESTTLLRELRLDSLIGDRIQVLEHVDDAQLDSLYRHCLFTVYPSLCEGWGLPVAESTAYGKFCIASDVRSIREIAPQLHEYLDPWDVRAWTERLEYYFINPLAIDEQNARVAALDYRPSWESTARSIVGVASRLAPQRPTATASQQRSLPVGV